MLVQSYDTGGLIEQQALSLVGEPWATEVVPRLPATLAAQARTLKAFQRARGLATPHDLVRVSWLMSWGRCPHAAWAPGPS